MTKPTPFNKLHISLMLKTWRNEKIKLGDYRAMLSETGITEPGIKTRELKYPSGTYSIFRIENDESHPDPDFLGQQISKLFSHLVIERIKGKDFIISVIPSSYLTNWLWKRWRLLEYKDARPNKLIDPIL